MPVASSPSSVKARGAARPRLLGSEEPRVFTPPLRELTPETSAGFSVITFSDEILGISLLPWQQWLLIHAMELLADGSFRFRTIVVLVARQNGKSTLGQVLALWFLYVRGVKLIIGTAQSLDTASEVWRGAVEIAEDTEALAEEIRKITRLNSRESLELTSGSRYKVAASTRRGGRGLSGDLILLDELREHQSWDAWGALTKTTMARADAQIWALSNAGDATSIVLRHLRKVAHGALGDPDGICDDLEETAPPVPDDDDELEEIEEEDPDSLGIFEWSAPPGCDLTDRTGWAQANPSMNYTLPQRNIADAVRTDPEWVLRTEVLCQWSDGSLEGPFPPGQWDAGQDVTSEIAPDSRLSWCVDVSVDRTRAHIAVAGLRADGLPHVEVVATRAGTDWVVGWFDDDDRVAQYETFDVVIQERSAPSSPLIEDLDELEHVSVVKWGGADLGNSTARMFDLVKASSLEGDVREGLCHLPQPLLDVAAANAVPKILTDGGMAWDRKKSPVDIAPLVAVTGALWHALQRPEAPVRSAYEDGGLMVV